MNSEEENKKEKNELVEKKSNLVKVGINIQEFREIIQDIIENSSILSLKEHVQHMKGSRFAHCYEVAFYTYVLTKKLGLDYISATRGAMLHDFYFYDWRNKGVEGQRRFHAYRHPRIALHNATQNFDLNEVEKDIILKHMWPLTFPLPKYSEGYIVTFVDKYCATKEFFQFLKYRKYLRKINKRKKEEEK